MRSLIRRSIAGVAILCAIGLVVGLGFHLLQDHHPAVAQTPDEDGAAAAEEESAKPAASADPQAAREEAFRATMSGATLDGKWRLVRDGGLGRELGDKYTLGEVKKVEGDRWTIEARIEYGDKDVRVPVPVRVLWAGDTPVITVQDLYIPGLGKYSARVLVHDGQYAGTWSAPDHGGLMSGIVIAPESE